MALDLDKEYYAQGYRFIVGTDEAGRGCLLGPVFAAAVIWPKGLDSSLINDSKKLTTKKREEAYDFIVKNAIAYAIASVDADEIDEVTMRDLRMICTDLIDNYEDIYENGYDDIHYIAVQLDSDMTECIDRIADSMAEYLMILSHVALDLATTLLVNIKMHNDLYDLNRFLDE